MPRIWNYQKQAAISWLFLKWLLANNDHWNQLRFWKQMYFTANKMYHERRKSTETWALDPNKLCS